MLNSSFSEGSDLIYTVAWNVSPISLLLLPGAPLGATNRMFWVNALSSYRRHLPWMVSAAADKKIEHWPECLLKVQSLRCAVEWLGYISNAFWKYSRFRVLCTIIIRLSCVWCSWIPCIIWALSFHSKKRHMFRNRTFINGPLERWVIPVWKWFDFGR